MEPPCIQLEMNFSGQTGNLFKERIDNGIFQVLVELNVPSADTRLSDAVSRFEEIEYLVQSKRNNLTSALAFSDDYRKSDPLDFITFASALCKTDRSAHLFYLSGRDKSREAAFAFLSHAVSEGFRTICPVSGSLVPGENLRQTMRHHFLESVEVLQMIQENFSGKLMAGGVINPFKYHALDDNTQFFKLIKKINFSAEFAVAQYGWDMLKLQELRWNLFRRSLHIPTIARLRMLTPEEAEDICSGLYPGVYISPDFQIALRKETQYSRAQFEAAQLRRLQIHAAGAKLLGYSGIQLSGIDSPTLLASALDRIAEAIQEFQSFEEWKEVYFEHYDRMDMAPYPHRFYMFENLFKTALPEEPLKIRNSMIEPPSFFKLLQGKIGHLLLPHADQLPAGDKQMTKKLFFSCKGCSLCRLPQTDFICPELCPKGLANGPCGCSKANGSCALSDRECVFSDRMRLAAFSNDYTSLEETLAKSPDKRPE